MTADPRNIETKPSIINISDRVQLEGGRETYLKRFGDLARSEGCEVTEVDAESLTSRGWSSIEPQPKPQPGSTIVFHSRTAWGSVEAVDPMYRRVGWVHDHAIYSVGGMSWLPRSGDTCDITVGARCLSRAYLERCANRRPDRLFRDWSATRKSFDAASHMDLMVVASRYMKDRLVRAGVEPQKVAVIPYFLDPDFLVGPPTAPPRARRILYMGRLHESKGVHVLFDLVRNLQTCELRIVGGGGGQYADAIHSQAGDLRREGAHVDLVPFTSDRRELARHYDEADVVVIPSLWPEPFGIVGLEAMGRGRPVVAFDVGGISDWLTDREVGFLCPPGDGPTMATRLETLLSSQQMCEEMGERGRQRVESSFSWELHWSSWKELMLPSGHATNDEDD